MKPLSALALVLFGAVLVGPGVGRAATLTYDLSGESAELYGSGDPSGSEYTSTPFSPGSSLTLEFDANGDGISGDVMVASSRFLVNGTFTSAGILLQTNFHASLIGGLGTLDALGNYVEWSQPASYFVSGTFQCFGINCALFSLPDGGGGTYDDWETLLGIATLPSISLGTWQLNQSSPGDLDLLCVSPAGHTCGWPIVTAGSTAVGIPTFGWRIGLDLHGHVVPEPAAALLVAVGLLALALRRRRSGTMRRHEVA